MKLAIIRNAQGAMNSMINRAARVMSEDFVGKSLGGVVMMWRL